MIITMGVLVILFTKEALDYFKCLFDVECVILKHFYLTNI